MHPKAGGDGKKEEEGGASSSFLLLQLIFSTNLCFGPSQRFFVLFYLLNSIIIG